MSIEDRMHMNSAFDEMASVTFVNRRAELNSVASSTGTGGISSINHFPVRIFVC